MKSTFGALVVIIALTLARLHTIRFHWRPTAVADVERITFWSPFDEHAIIANALHEHRRAIFCPWIALVIARHVPETMGASGSLCLEYELEIGMQADYSLSRPLYLFKLILDLFAGWKSTFLCRLLELAELNDECIKKANFG